MTSMHSKMVIAPHIDDEVLGCASILDSDTLVWFCGIDESLVPSDPAHRLPVAERYLEADRVANYFGYYWAVDMETKVNYLDLQHVKDSIENLINSNQPRRIFIPCKCFNQDHNTVNDACIIALRPHDKNWFVPQVVEYESVHDFTWPAGSLDVNYFVPLDIEKKLEGYRLHTSQVRSHRSPENVRQLAALRGASVQVPYAEGFKVLRWLE